ncbi:MAG: alcohol dehydrogenase catalytic domain-containing protein [Spirochaetales bacterium]|nr:alcohol dehydrogenase catalytic domain-containing protein [Spirochaetales bacterium]
MDTSLAVILEKPETIAVKEIPVPPIPGSSVRVQMRACGICGSDVRYFAGDNPWSLHTLGKQVPSPPNMVLGHEVAGVIRRPGGETPVAILAYKGCGRCDYCRSGRENLCSDMEHFGHGAGWQQMPYYPGGMSEQFDIWEGFAYEIPPQISFEEAVFLDGLAVAVHAVDQSALQPGQRFGVVGLGPIGLLAAQVARSRGASLTTGCDTSDLPVQLAQGVGLGETIRGDSTALAKHLRGANRRLDAVVDTVGSPESIRDSLSMLDKSGTLVLLAVHGRKIPIAPIWFSGERRIMSSANNRYGDFPRAIELMASGAVKVKSLITHRFALPDAPEAFRVMLHKDREKAYKVVLHPELACPPS